MFIVGAMAFSRVGGLNYAVRAVGAFLALLYLVYTLRGRTYLSTEVFLYAAFFGWATIGVFVARSPVLFWTKMFTLFQIWVLLVIVCGQASGRRELSLSLFALLVGAAIVGTASVATGSYREVAERGERLAALGTNANGFGRIMIYATVSLMYFWMMPARLGRVKYLLLGVPMFLAAVGCVLSGSRFSVLGLALLYLLWAWFCYRRSAAHQGRILLAVVLGLTIGGYAFVSYAAKAHVGRRFVAAWETIGGRRADSGTLTRMELYRFGLDLTLRNPFVGVGLDNFRVHTGHLPAHSEWIEIPATTGLPGAAAYFAIYAVLWFRTGRIRRDGSDPVAGRVAGLTRAVVLTLLFLGLGATNYFSKEAWILLGSFIGYTNVVWHGVRAVAAGAPGLTSRSNP